MNALIDDFQEVSIENEQLIKDFSDKKTEFLEIKNCLNEASEENLKLMKQVEKLDALMLNLKFKILKLTISEKGKGKMSEEHQKTETGFKECKIEFFCEKKVRKITQEIFHRKNGCRKSKQVDSVFKNSEPTKNQDSQ